MAKAGLSSLRKAENDDWLRLGRAVDHVRWLQRLSLKEFAAALKHEQRQVARWILGLERPQIEAVYAVAKFRGHLIVALAEQDDALTVRTVIEIRRTA